MIPEFGDPRLPERFWDFVEIADSGCWHWTGSIGKQPRKGGYSKFKYEGKTQSGHKVAYLALIGPVPAGLEIDHICQVRHCVNPNHLRAITHLLNCAEGNKHNKHRTQCRYGHPYDKVHKGERAGRYCSICQNQRRAKEFKDYLALGYDDASLMKAGIGLPAKLFTFNHFVNYWILSKPNE